MPNRSTRRVFLRDAAFAAALVPSSLSGFGGVPSLLTNARPGSLMADDKPVRLGFIGTGFRGRDHIQQALYRPDVQIPAICDTSDEAIQQTLALFDKLGKPRPVVYGNGGGARRDEAFKELLKRDDIDGVVIATPWEWHTPMAVETMKAGKYAGVEVSATVTLNESWDLVNTFEKTGSPCMILENVCYRRDVLMVLNMIRQGLFGEMTYAHCGYQHDLRAVKFNDGKHYAGGGVEFGAKGYAEARWRTQHSVDRNGDIYPTHGLGPVAHWLNINRGNRFTALSSTATKSRGLHKYVVDNGGANHPNANVNFKLGDVVTTMLQCANGETIVIIHDTNSPRPYSLGFRAQGTEGIWMDDNDSVFFQNRTAKGDKPKAHSWEPFAAYEAEFDHPLWKKHAANADKAGHGGIDFFVMRAFIEAVKYKTQPPIDVYDAAVWSAISPLSEKSIAKGGQLVEVPDFTRGKWKTNAPIFALNDAF
ncbi:oxidoreductase domain protein [Fibrella aestuarina BUZ 2]|uniref:Oxidoreductase domain protein n=1 Tax=Fibrella aestuarina BUZ 2 TaxID=1166018 RepID=I0K9X4_9BACT|nr:Gfo/Idh/MocA family oxidoreductase [Fibrella aestuarina]CCH00927.1 oxidoreductase domain protein [Fibrella aestuarina BUZ 2]